MAAPDDVEIEVKPDVGGVRATGPRTGGRLAEQRRPSSIRRAQHGGAVLVAAAVARLKRLSGNLLRGNIEEQFYCALCLCNEAVSSSYAKDGCGHRFCRACLSEYLNCDVRARQFHCRPHSCLTRVLSRGVWCALGCYGHVAATFAQSHSRDADY